MPKARNTPKSRLKHEIALYIFLLLFGWIVLMFVVIPWDYSGHMPPGSFELIEGQRAYAMLVRKERPTLAKAIRGLNMVGARFTQGDDGSRRWVSSGNIRIYFNNNGQFDSLDILKTAPEAQQ